MVRYPTTFRTIESRDIPAIREIDRLAFDAEEQYECEFYDAILTDSALEAFLAQDQGAVVAWALLDVSSKPTRLRSLSVHPDYQRRGYGKALLEHALAQWPQMDLLVRRDNLEAIALYESIGFERTTRDAEMPHRLRMIKLG